MQNINHVSRAAEAIANELNCDTKVAVILGSGLSGFVNRLTSSRSLAYQQIPHWSPTTVTGHHGRLVYGMLDECPVLALDGRLHRYEGWSNEQITFPVHVLSALGVRTLVISNAAGGMNHHLRVGDIVLISDHVHWQFGVSALRFVPKVPQTCEFNHPDAGLLSIRRGSNPHDSMLIERALSTARKHGFAAYRGVYLSTLGPNYETRAEYRMFRRLGADVVGMSTLPEVLAAQSLRLRVLAMSMVSNIARPDSPTIADHQEVLAAGKLAESKMTMIVRDILQASRNECIDE